MVKDFLPICDLILYVFSATNALSIPDLSVLHTLQEELDFVPIRFVVTRSDEFRKDHSHPLTCDNFDSERADQFLGHLIGRIRAQAPKLNLERSNFSFVDNRTNFGIGELTTAIAIELGSDVQLHSKKIAYFRRGLNGQKAIFERYLTTLIDDVAELEHKAKVNKERYDKNIVLSFQSINDFWRPREAAQTTRVGASQKLKQTWEAINSRQKIDFASRWLAIPRVQALVEQKSTEFAQDVRGHCLELANAELRRRAEELQSNLSSLIKTRSTINFVPLPPDMASRLSKSLAPNIARNLRSASELTKRELLIELTQSIQNDRTTFETLFDHARRGDLAAKDEEYYRDFETVIRNNLREFLPIVALFKSFVTSAHARNLISRTGLGARLDVLDSVDVDIVSANYHGDEFLSQVFGTRSARRKSLARAGAELLERKDLIESELEELLRRANDEAHSIVDIFSLSAVESEAELIASNLVEPVIVVIQREMLDAQREWGESIGLAQVKFGENVIANRMQVVKEWAGRLSVVVGLAAFFGVLAILGIFASGLQDRIGWSLTILSGALTTVTVSVLGWGWKRLSASGFRLPKTRSRIAQEVTKTSSMTIEPVAIGESPELNKAVAEAKANFDSAIMEFVARGREEKVTQYTSIGEGEHNLIQVESKYRLTYLHEWDSLAAGMNDWYRPDEFKRKLISDVAASIKERAIEPALTLFADRLHDVRDFSDRLRALVM